MLEELQDRLEEEEVECTEEDEQSFLEICRKFSITPDELVTKWDAFIYGKTGKDFSADSYVVADLLDDFQKFVKDRLKTQKFKETLKKRNFLTHQTPKRAPQHNAQSVKQSGSIGDIWGVDIAARTPVTPALLGKKRKLMFVTPSSQKSQRTSPSNIVLASPATGKYASRTKKGDIAVSYNDKTLASVTGYPITEIKEGRIKITSKTTDKQFRYMHMTLHQTAEALNSNLETMLDYVSNSAEFQALPDPTAASNSKIDDEKRTNEMSPLNTPSQATVYFGGRIHSSNDAKLQRANIILEGDMERSRGQRVKLGLDLLDSYQLFPGQIVVGKGVNTDGTTFVVEELYPISPKPYLRVPLQEARACDSQLETRPLSIMSAAGPFTTHENHNYNPLFDFATEALVVQPDVILLMGPFVPVGHKYMANEPFGERFERVLNDFIRMVDVLKHTHLLVVMSPNDAFHVPILPQPAFRLRPDSMSLNRGFIEQWKDQDRLHFLPNPAVVTINDFTLAVVGADVVRHLFAHSVYKRGKGPAKGKHKNRLLQLTSELLHQHSLYPLMAPLDSATQCVDWTKISQLQLDHSPDLLITSSQLKHFVSDIGGGESGPGKTVAMNIETLAKGATGGMYGLCTIHPRQSGALDSVTDGEVEADLKARIRVDIVRV